MQEAAVNGTTIAYNDQGSGQPLLLVHGFPLDHTMWRHQIGQLADSFRVIAPDLRGFGLSPLGELPSASPSSHLPLLTMRQLADDLAALLDELGIAEPIHFCGLSMGGYIGWQFWDAYRIRMRSLVLCDTRAANDTEETARGRRMMAQQVMAEGAGLAAKSMLPKLFAPDTATTGGPLVNQIRQVILRTSPETIAAAQRGMAERPDMRPRLGEIIVPTLVVCGQHDVISPPTEMREIAAALPRSQYADIATAGHMSPLESPDSFNLVLRDFLATQ